jgi:hypothetical protein
LPSTLKTVAANEPDPTFASTSLKPAPADVATLSCSAAPEYELLAALSRRTADSDSDTGVLTDSPLEIVAAPDTDREPSTTAAAESVVAPDTISDPSIDEAPVTDSEAVAPRSRTTARARKYSAQKKLNYFY